MTKMWNWAVELIPENRLEAWASTLTVLAIVFPLIGGLLGWLAVDVSSKVSELKDKSFAKRIADAEAAAKPKPFKERLRIFLDSIDPAISEALKTQDVKLNCQLRANQMATLEDLISSPESAGILHRLPSEVDLLQIRTDGNTNGATLMISRAALAE